MKEKNNIQTYIDKIPQELQILNQWVLWKLEITSKGRPTKIPYQAVNIGYKASSTNKEDWASFSQAVNIYINNKDQFDGIGFVFSKDDHYVGIDMDHILNDDGETSKEAQIVINRLSSYTERSQSGTGAHIIVKVNDKTLFLRGRKSKDKKFEIYSISRYFVTTGNIIGANNKIEERQQELEDLYKDLFSVDKSECKNLSKNNQVLSDKEIINKLSKAKNSNRFETLYYSGDTSFYNYDDSAADLALCNMISFYTDDFNQVDRLFSNSSLYREKWDRLDYKSGTINKALEGNFKYDSDYNKSSSNILINNNERIVESKSFLVPKNSTKPDGQLKVDISRLAMYLKQKYNIKYYKTQFRVMKNNYYSHIQDIKLLISKEIPEIYRIPQNIRDCEELLTMDINLVLTDEELAPQKYISFENGVLDVENMEFSTYENEFIKKLIFINQIGYKWNPDVEPNELTDNFFKSITNGISKDIDYLYQVLGVLISGYRSYKNIFYFTGIKDSGKSKFLAIAENLLTNPDGTKDFSNIGLKTLTDETSKEFVKIIGKRANICGETPHLKISNDVLLKQLSGGDSINAQVKFKESIEFKNKAMLIFAGNTVPNFFVSDKSSIGERLLIYRFKNAIPKNQQVKNIDKKLSMEYIIKRSLDQLRIFIDNNQEFNVPKEIFANQEDMLKDSDAIYKFYKESCIMTDSTKDRISNSDLYESYIQFLYKEGHIRLSSWDNKPDMSHLKITQYIFTTEIKKFHGPENYKRNLSYNDSKADVFINMKVKQELLVGESLKGFSALNKREDKIIRGVFGNSTT